MHFEFQNHLRLQVAVNNPLGNRIYNPSGEYGVVGWTRAGTSTGELSVRSATFNSNYNITYPTFWNAAGDPDYTELIMHNDSLGQSRVYSNQLPMKPGQYITGKFLTRGKGNSTYVFGQWQFLNSAGSVLSFATTTYSNVVQSVSTTTQTISMPTTQAPTGTVAVRLHIVNNNANSTAIGNVPAWSWLMFKNATMLISDTSPTPGAEVPPLNEWVDVLAEVSSVNIIREELNVGTMSVEMTSSLYDPATSPVLRRGAKIRLQSLVDDVWESQFVGTITMAHSRYIRGEDKPVIHIEADDAVSILANRRETRGVDNMKSLAGIMPADVPWAYNGGAFTTPEYNYTYFAEDMSVLDIAVIARDTVMGYIWLDRNGTLQLWDQALPTNVTIQFSDLGNIYSSDRWLDYTELVAGYNWDELVNSVIVKRMEVVSSTEAEEVVYGPYENAESIYEYGTYNHEVTVSPIGVTSGIANVILNRYSQPKVVVTEVAWEVTTEAKLGQAAKVDLYDYVGIVYDKKGLSFFNRVSRVEHQITPFNWTVTLGTRAGNSLAGT